MPYKIKELGRLGAIETVKPYGVDICRAFVPMAACSSEIKRFHQRSKSPLNRICSSAPDKINLRPVIIGIINKL